VSGAVVERPQLAGSFSIRWTRSKQPCANPEQGPPAELQAIDRLLAPRKRFQEGQPGILEPRKLRAGHTARQQLTNNGVQSRLGGRLFAPIQLFEPLAPPGEPDRAKVRVGAGRDHIGEGKIEIPKRLEGRSNPRGQLLKRDLAVEI